MESWGENFCRLRVFHVLRSHCHSAPTCTMLTRCGEKKSEKNSSTLTFLLALVSFQVSRFSTTHASFYVTMLSLLTFWCQQWWTSQTEQVTVSRKEKRYNKSWLTMTWTNSKDSSSVNNKKRTKNFIIIIKVQWNSPIAQREHISHILNEYISHSLLSLFTEKICFNTRVDIVPGIVEGCHRKEPTCAHIKWIETDEIHPFQRASSPTFTHFNILAEWNLSEKKLRHDTEKNWLSSAMSLGF